MKTHLFLKKYDKNTNFLMKMFKAASIAFMLLITFNQNANAQLQSSWIDNSREPSIFNYCYPYNYYLDIDVDVENTYPASSLSFLIKWGDSEADWTIAASSSSVTKTTSGGVTRYQVRANKTNPYPIQPGTPECFYRMNLYLKSGTEISQTSKMYRITVWTQDNEGIGRFGGVNTYD